MRRPAPAGSTVTGTLGIRLHKILDTAGSRAEKARHRHDVNLVSTGYLDGFYYKPRIDKDLLAAHSKGLIALSVCLRGDINETLIADKYEAARRLAYQYTDTFGRTI
ncbi:MAG: PHP domain-containing protein, partial [Acidobacteriota bacterium]